MCVLLNTLSGAVHATPASNAFDLGVKAFKQANYAEALNFFEQAKKSGASHKNLQYNLAVCYYRLSRWQEAATTFRSLLEDPQMSQIARYNLGLIAARQDQLEQAKKWFRLAAKGKDVKIVSLSVTALKRLGVTTDTSVKHKYWSGLVSFGFGTDNNVSRANDDIITSTTVSDGFSELLASADYPLLGTREQGLRLGGSLYNQAYSNESSYNFAMYRLFSSWHQRLLGWNSRLTLGHSKSEFGSEPFQSKSSIGIRFQTRVGESKNLVRLRYRFNSINSDAKNYDYLEGDQHQLRISYHQRFGISRANTYYTYENNDRRDLVLRTTFYSYSPQRNTLRFKLDTHWSRKWSTQLDTRYRLSRYADAHILPGGFVRKRFDKRTQLKMSVTQKFNKHWRGYLEHQINNNNSNIDRYDYQRSVSFLGLRYLL